MGNLDKTDLEIISLLKQDGRMSFVRMAELLGVSEGTVRRKASALINNGTIAVTAVVNPPALGFDTPAIVGISADQKKSLKLAKQIAEMPEVQFVVITTGPYEIMIQALTESNEDLFDFLLRVAQLDGIKATQTFLILRIYKLSGNLGIVKGGTGAKRREPRPPVNEGSHRIRRRLEIRHSGPKKRGIHSVFSHEGKQQ
jgi:Lrp/AsnC family transcriptional regulator for asnA, asnC and gidA